MAMNTGGGGGGGGRGPVRQTEKRKSYRQSDFDGSVDHQMDGCDPDMEPYP